MEKKGYAVSCCAAAVWEEPDVCQLCFFSWIFCTGFYVNVSETPASLRDVL